MPKFPKPFFRKDRGLWYVQIDGRQYNLGPDKDLAWERYHLLMANRTKPVECDSPTILAVLDQFLVWTEANRAQRTFEWHTEQITSFLKSVDPQCEVVSLRVFDVTKWMADNSHWNPTTRNGAISSLKRAFNWAVKQGLIDTNPIAHAEKPTKRRRTIVLSEEQRKKLLGCCKDERFFGLVRFMALTGCRPKEVRILEKRHVDLENSVIVFPPEESKGNKDPRLIVLNPDALAIISKLAEEHAEGPLFRNSKGEPWTRNAIRCRFRRLKEKTGVPKLSAYVLRHTFATDALANGVDAATVAALMGHRDTAMVSRVYGHLDQRLEYLKSQAKRAVS